MLSNFLISQSGALADDSVTSDKILDATIVDADINASAAIALSKLASDPSNASNLASGTVPTARLGSGTASSSTFLRGDGSWAAAGGGKVLQVVFTQGTSGDIDVDNNTTPTSAGSAFLVSITPAATSSKILIEFGSAYGKSQGGTYNGKVALHRQIASGAFTNLNTGTDGMAYIRNTHPHPWVSSYVDSPSTTSAINYQLYVYTHGNDVVEFAEDGYWRFIRATEIAA